MKNSRDKLLAPLLLLVLLHLLVPYLYNTLTKTPASILNYLNPLYYLEFYVRMPLFSAAILGLIALFMVVSYEASNELVLEHEDQSRLATEEEISGNFTKFDPYKKLKEVKK